MSDEKSVSPPEYPEGVGQTAWRLKWGVIIVFVSIHVLSLLIFFPWFFSWEALVATLISAYVIGCLGINVCYHRLLTHRSFQTPKWFEYLLTLLASCNLEGSSRYWVSVHNMHHKYSDERPDPHTPQVADFPWAHILWMMVHNKEIDDRENLEKYSRRDIWNDPLHRWLDEGNKFFLVWIFFALGVSGTGYLVGELSDKNPWQMSASFFVWAVAFRTVLGWHVTWAVNSVTHVCGYKNYETTDHSGNVWWLALLTFGESWHNNHHADELSAAHGHKWWEFDLTYLTIRFFGLIGLAKKIRKPKSWASNT